MNEQKLAEGFSRVGTMLVVQSKLKREYNDHFLRIGDISTHTFPPRSEFPAAIVLASSVTTYHH